MASTASSVDDAFLTSTSKRPPRLGKRDGDTSGRSRGLVGGWLPIPIFLVISLAFAFLWPVMPIAPCALAVLAAIAASYHHTAQSSSWQGSETHDQLKADVAGLVFTTSILAVVLGIMAGCYAAEQHMRAVYSISFGQSYAGVDARSNGAAYKDAGEISFDLSAVADTEQSLGYKDHSVFCVAPVLDASDQVSNVYFWAVGYDCCNARGGFDCGGVAPGTRGGGGVRLAPDDGLLGRFGLFGHPQTAEFLAAAKQAAAIYDLQLPPDEDIVLLEWVRSTSEVQVFHILRVIGSIAMGSLLFMLMVIVLSVVYTYHGGMSAGNRGSSELESLPK